MGIGQAGSNFCVCLLKKKVFILTPIIVFVYSFCCVYTFIFCISCIAKMQESSRRGSHLPPSRWFQWGWGGEVDLPLIHFTRPHSIHRMHWVTRRRGLGGGGGGGGIPGSHSTGFPPVPLTGFSLSCIFFFFWCI